MENSRIPVTIITGFLGAGKTTLLNNLIKKHTDTKFAIIENEFGEIGIDGALIVGADQNIFELSNGCICCSLNDDFYETIFKLLDGDYDFDHLLVETTGIADPSSIINAFVATLEIQMKFMLDSVICLADAINVEDIIEEQPEVKKQLAIADIILLNKVSDVSATYAKELELLISGINPLAHIYQVSHADINDLKILGTFAYSGKEIEKSTIDFKNVTLAKTDETTHGVSHHHHHGHHHHEISAEGFSLEGSFDDRLFTLWIQHFLAYNQDSIFRVKGILSINNMDERLIFHAVRSSYLFEKGEAWGSEKRFSKMVFIGKNINHQTLENDLAKLIYKKH